MMEKDESIDLGEEAKGLLTSGFGCLSVMITKVDQYGEIISETQRKDFTFKVDDGGLDITPSYQEVIIDSTTACRGDG